MTDKIVVFDGECRYCTMTSKTVQTINNDITVIDWQNNIVQEFLEIQFDSTPFSMIFIDIDREEVLVGDSAADRIASNSKVTKSVSSFISTNYDEISSTVRFLSRRNRSTDEEYYGTYDLDEEAKQKIKQLSD
jgi:predicted DCC family thiol-disulfide oxidoreductase YuxK